MPAQPQPPSLLSAGTSVNGMLRADGDIRIDGTLDGDVVCANLIVGAHGVIRGEVRAETVTLRGRIEGSVHARQLSLAASAHVTGDITYQSLEAELGARIEARFHHAAHAPTASQEDQQHASVPMRAREAQATAAPRLLAAS